MKVDLRPIESIRPYENNPRKNEDAVAAVAASLKEFGFRKPIVVDADGVIVAGHTCYQAALTLGLPSVPVHVIDNVAGEKIRAYRIADNKTSEISEWDYNLLAIELAELAPADLQTMTEYGFDAATLASLLDGDASPPASEDQSRSTSIENLRFGTHSIPLSEEELTRMDSLLAEHISRVGTPYGFIAWLVSHVPS